MATTYKIGGNWADDNARFLTLPLDMAQSFRYILRSYFGENAETNRTITKMYIVNYFKNKESFSIDDIRNSMLLDKIHAALCVLNGTDETWTIFDKYGDRI